MHVCLCTASVPGSQRLEKGIWFLSAGITDDCELLCEYGTRIWVFWESSQCSEPQSNLSSPTGLLLREMKTIIQAGTCRSYEGATYSRTRAELAFLDSSLSSGNGTAHCENNISYESRRFPADQSDLGKPSVEAHFSYYSRLCHFSKATRTGIMHPSPSWHGMLTDLVLYSSRGCNHSRC